LAAQEGGRKEGAQVKYTWLQELISVIVHIDIVRYGYGRFVSLDFYIGVEPTKKATAAE
jgi:hypothetical protein